MKSEGMGQRGSLSRWLAPCLLLLVLAGLWQWGVGFQKTPLIPGPLAVFTGIADLARSGLLVKHIVASLFRVTWGFLLAVLTAIPFGLHLGWHRRTALALNPSLQILRPISPLAWIPLAILWFGVGDLSAVFLIFLASFLPLTVTAINAVGSIPSIYLDAGRNFGLSPAQVIYRVLYPAVLPKLVVGLRLAFGIAWLVVVAAEMVAVNSGLGFLIIDARNAANRYDLVIAGMLLIGTIGFIFDAAFRRMEKMPALRWGYETE